MCLQIRYSVITYLYQINFPIKRKKNDSALDTSTEKFKLLSVAFSTADAGN
jgi:hypothetical protein